MNQSCGPFATMCLEESIEGRDFLSSGFSFFFFGMRPFLLADDGWRWNQKPGEAGFPTILKWPRSKRRLRSYDCSSRVQIIAFLALDR